VKSLILHKINGKIEIYLHSNFEMFSKVLEGEAAQNANLERWTEGHTYTPRTIYGMGAARCRGGGAYLLTTPDHTLLKEAAELWPILEELLSPTRISAGADRCLNVPSSAPLSDVIAWVHPIAVRVKGADFSACVICQRIGWVVEIDLEAEQVTLSYIRASQGLLSYVKEVS
jgi:hypothetical protein